MAVVGAKGGVGRGTVAVATLGHAFALHRRDRVVSLDGAADWRAESWKQRFNQGSSTPTITDLLAVDDSTPVSGGPHMPPRGEQRTADAGDGPRA
ncbi:hypothetical protein GS528_17135 [Rhodococcus hoagii]|nr:hypothetical protein [Prescottella equi]